MKKTYISLASITIILMLLMTSCLSVNPKEDIAICSVSGVGTVTLDPDVALFSIEISEIRDTTSQALQQANKKMISLLETLREFEIAEVDLKTTSINLRADYDWIDGKQVLNGQRASQSISVKLRDITKLGSIIDKLSQVNGLNLGSVTFDKDDKSAAYAAARVLSVQQAELKAQNYAQSTGLELGNPIDINENSNTSSPYYRNNLAKSAVMFESMAAPSYDTEAPVGQFKITSTVHIVYQLVK